MAQPLQIKQEIDSISQDDEENVYAFVIINQGIYFLPEIVNLIRSNDKNHFFGNVSAKGGKDRGDGGFVEVSSKLDWIYKGKVTTLAENGEAGMLLFDPCDVDIGNYGGSGSSTPAFPGIPPFDYPPSPYAGTATLDVVDLRNGLLSNNVTINTNGSLGFGPYIACPWR